MTDKELLKSMSTVPIKELREFAKHTKKGIKMAEKAIATIPAGKPNVVDFLPPGKIGKAEISHFEVTEEGARWNNLRAAINHRAIDVIQPGKYARLLVDGELMMTDTQMEWRSNRAFIRAAKGDVLIAGLGIGMVLKAVLDKPEVAHVTVIELSKDVIDLVGPHLKHQKLDIINADFLEFRPPKDAKWDVIYIDIWPNICTDNLKEMYGLERKFKKFLKPDGWIDCWSRDRLEGM